MWRLGNISLLPVDCRVLNCSFHHYVQRGEGLFEVYGCKGILTKKLIIFKIYSTANTPWLISFNMRWLIYDADIRNWYKHVPAIDTWEAFYSSHGTRPTRPSTYRTKPAVSSETAYLVTLNWSQKKEKMANGLTQPSTNKSYISSFITLLNKDRRHSFCQRTNTQEAASFDVSWIYKYDLKDVIIDM